LLAGAVQETLTVVELCVEADGLVGAPGVPTWMAADGAEGTPVPLVLMAETVNVYVVPEVSPVKTHVVDVPFREVEQAAGVVTDGLDVTV